MKKPHIFAQLHDDKFYWHLFDPIGRHVTGKSPKEAFTNWIKLLTTT